MKAAFIHLGPSIEHDIRVYMIILLFESVRKEAGVHEVWNVVSGRVIRSTHALYTTGYVFNRDKFGDVWRVDEHPNIESVLAKHFEILL